jgi:hypothetical protein
MNFIFLLERIPLKTPVNTNLNPFEQGNTDHFEVKCQDLGRLKKITLDLE